MSDMLQLVVEIHNTQAMLHSQRRQLRVPTPDDKLKHIGTVEEQYHPTLPRVLNKLRKSCEEKLPAG